MTKINRIKQIASKNPKLQKLTCSEVENIKEIPKFHPISPEDFANNHIKIAAAEQKLIDKVNKRWEKWPKQLKNYEENEKKCKL